jgi:hypothetical protein
MEALRFKRGLGAVPAGSTTVPAVAVQTTPGLSSAPSPVVQPRP